MTVEKLETILIVEDDEGVARLQQRRLERAGYVVIVATTTHAALGHILAGGVNLLVLDFRLSAVEDGLEFYARLKTAGHALPVIMVTGYSDDATIVKALRAGVRDYIFKSVEYLAYLPEACQRVLDQVRVEREREQALAELQAKTAELQTTTQQLWQAAKLAGVGELAASIAHELNNPLATVSLRVEGLLAKTTSDDPRHRPLVVIEGEVKRMAGLVANLLNFSRAGRDEVSTIDLHEEIAKTIDLVDHHLTRMRIQIEPDFSRSMPMVNADRQQLRQVLLNLLTNAADAMPNGGRLVIRVRPGDLKGRPAVVIEVTDTGTGIKPEFLSRIFDPFFTTKEEGKGTGLGLAICKRIVDQHQGILEVESKVGVGTTVRVTLPVRTATDPGGSRHD